MTFIYILFKKILLFKLFNRILGLEPIADDFDPKRRLNPSLMKDVTNRLSILVLDLVWVTR